MKYRKEIFSVFYFIITVAIVHGCASPDYIPTRTIQAPKRGVYHKVRPGETLWRIAKAYDVSINEIVRANRIPNAAHIENGQLIYIPDTQQKKKVLVDANSQDPNEFSWPLRGKVISYFGQSSPTGINYGINIQADGSDTVYASRAGKIVFADNLTGFNKTVIIDHEDGYYTVYAQNADLLVKVGNHIEKGFPLARLNNDAYGAYLHFEIRKNDVADNPLYYLP